MSHTLAWIIIPSLLGVLLYLALVMAVWSHARPVMPL